MTLHAVAGVERLRDDRALRVKAGTEDVILLRQASEVRAYQARCPHAGAPLEKGAICEGRLICPWHKAAFAIDDGEVREPPALVSLKRYPAHVSDGTLWVDDQSAPPPTPVMQEDLRCFIVVGAGAAGTAAVATLQERGYAGRLIWIDQEERPAYDRTALSKFVIAGKMRADEVPPLLSEDRCQNPELLRLQGTVTAIDAKARILTLRDGQRLAYDAALLATGGIPQRPAIGGAQLPGAFVLRSRADAAQLLEWARESRCAVIIGDSFIGLEAASALRHLGLQVHVVTRHEVPMVKQLGEQIGRSLRELHQQHGVIFHCSTEPTSLESEARLMAVILKNGERIDTDLVLFGTGVKPATQLAQGLAMAEDQSLIVDASLRTAAGLWAVGDMVSFPLAGRPTRIEHWRVAQQQARLAAANMLGDQREFADVPFFWTYHYGKNLEVLGHTRDWSRIEVVGNVANRHFIALMCVDERVESIVACGFERATAMFSQRMKRPLSRSHARKLIDVWRD